ncbi:MAG: chromosome condensation regulator RCC1 [Pseudomonadota bacterium]|nr:chromosome condensation regulator RCC1 [Pseudomonadota bacterium]
MRAIIVAILSLGLIAISPNASAQQLTGGAGHTCAIVPGGTLMCWGWDEQGQLGDTAQNYSNASPVLAEGITGTTSIDAGGQHGCAVVAGGAVKCWGYNLNGQLGNDTTSSSDIGVNALGISGATAIGTGGSHSCALLGDGSVWCWGHGYHGQLGTGVFIESDVPLQVSGVSGATAIAAGDNHSCAIVGTGTIKCWGRNDWGQLGNGGNNPDPGVANAVDVFGISNAIAISAGTRHTCALRANNAVACWGHGGYGTLGDGQSQPSPSPVTVPGINNAVALVAGDYHNCVLHTGGSMSCWGYNYFGTIGDGSNRNNYASPQSVVALSGITAIGAGSEHTCARVSQNPINVKCWGHGNFGQLGDGQIGGAHENPNPAFVLGGPFDVIFGGGPGNFE